jgi:hypothetical protein
MEVTVIADKVGAIFGHVGTPHRLRLGTELSLAGM